MAFKNLKAEIRRDGITQRQIAESMGMSENNFSLKMNERIPLTVDEAKFLQQTYFEGNSLDYLLESDGDMPSDRERKLAEIDAVGELVDATGTRDVFGDAIADMRAEYSSG